jgi:hypothetical protein
MAEPHAAQNTSGQFTRSLLDLERDDPRHARAVELKLLSILKVRTGIASIQNDSRRHAAARLISGIDLALQKQVIERVSVQPSRESVTESDKELGR